MNINLYNLDDADAGMSTRGFVIGTSEWSWLSEEMGERICAALTYFHEMSTESIKRRANGPTLLDPDITCRGCYALGTACGQCIRCQEEVRELLDKAAELEKLKASKP